MHATAEGREHADAPVPDLVAEALDHDRAVGGDDAGRALLLPQEGQEVSRSTLLEPVLRLHEAARVLVVAGHELATRPSDPLAELGRTTDALAFPEGRNTWHSGGGRDEHPVSRDLLDPPHRGAQKERLSRPCLVHHLLVELTDAPTAVDEEHSEQPSVRDRARVRHRQPARSGAPSYDAGGPVPDDSRTKLRELVGRIAPGKHVEDVLELGAGKLGEGVRAANELVQLVNRHLLVRADGHDLLREHVERVPGYRRLLDRSLAHGARDHCRLEEVGPELREDPTLRDRMELVSGAPDPLKPAGDRLRALDLDHEIDRSHVDPELERRGRDEARDLPCLQQLLHHHPLLSGE